MRRFVDISVPLEDSANSDPELFRPSIEYKSHEETFEEIASFFPGLKKEDLPDGEAWAHEKLNVITHNGTHLDAPYHFASTMNGGEPALTIDQVPLEWCFQPAIKLDFRELPDGYCHIEKLHNLESLPSKGFFISCFPVKIKAASAGWTRAVAIIES